MKNLWTEIDFVELTEHPNDPTLIDTNTHVFRHPELKEDENVHEHRCWKSLWDPRKDFHVYACEWGEENIRWYTDGELVGTRTNDYWHQPLDVVLSMGLRIPLKNKESSEGFPSECEVDYIRVWKKAVGR